MNRIIQVGFLLLLIVAASHGFQPRCAEVGQPCTYHSECCSNSCMFYLHKCVSGRKAKDPIVPESEKACLGIGDACSSPEQCCSKRCPSYWAKCTT